MLTFDIVIATRNRLDALKMAIPLMLAQSRQPEQLIVVDSSDDHAQVKALVETLTQGWPRRVIIIHEAKPSLTRQRNIGLDRVSADVVMYPDDDSLWHAGVAEAVMAAYEADKDGRVGGVCGKPVTESPLANAELLYKKSQLNTLKSIFQPVRNRLEARMAPKPFDVFAHEAWKQLPSLPWLSQKNCVLVETMAGFRMSFRTSVIRQLRFDETIGSRVGYATHEDMEASVHVLKAGYLLVGALDAKIFHHKHYSPRTGAFKYGFCQIANYLYIVRKHMSEDSVAYKATERFLFYKIMLYGLSYADANDRLTFKGAMAAWKERDKLLRCDPAQLEHNYIQLCDQHMAGR